VEQVVRAERFWCVLGFPPQVDQEHMFKRQQERAEQADPFTAEQVAQRTSHITRVAEVLVAAAVMVLILQYLDTEDGAGMPKHQLSLDSAEHH
jgi:hypothetical protein